MGHSPTSFDFLVKMCIVSMKSETSNDHTPDASPKSQSERPHIFEGSGRWMNRLDF